ncbi:protein kinase/AAA ATPase/GAF sensor-containing signal transduction histidine kinase [Oleiphilus messinensis]|uniref:histidine kinase n=2 Tax=Oleiphilus messinensis TaxID=141451 RepID=A0A1Y0IBN9_9GAMM|nr:protein kinase/AAA ATPase/GAF sensor-containing signal transduction histidine kinase [Oleiphilus messinensis]
MQVSRLWFNRDILSLFDHPNVIKLLDWIDVDQQYWLVMEDITGVELDTFSCDFPERQLPLQRFYHIAIQLADALSNIHHQQVIHKDLHPGNIVINRDSNRVQIIDFGLASLLSREQPCLAPPEQLEGMLDYISPEQTGRMNRALDYRTDFYTLGVTLYQLLTGKLPFRAEDALGLIYAHLAVQQRPVHHIRPDIPESLSAIIDKLLAKNAEDRYQSAQGLKFDLEQCQSLPLSSAGGTFKLAQRDISDRFQIPQTLYGRETEIQGLLNLYQKILAGQPQLLTVAGYSGIGKSALVHEIHKPVAAHQGIYISGKFDQFQRNTPYSALKSALQGWFTQVLQRPKEKLDELRGLVLRETGAMARVLIDFMGEFKLLLGDLPALPDLGPKETQIRFHRVFRAFIAAVTTSQPWVLFVDDLQWADRGTLNLIPELLLIPQARLLLILAYRDNEVDMVHPLNRMLVSVQRDAKGIAGQCTELRLQPLSLGQIRTLLANTLHQSTDVVSPLAALVHHKAGGNPFFTIEFLKTLYRKQLLNFSLEAHRWQWDDREIEREDITDNVVELMLQRMSELPKDTQALMQLASCVGSRFDLAMLACISDKSFPETVDIVWPALRDGLLVQEGGDWFPGLLDIRSGTDDGANPEARANVNSDLNPDVGSGGQSVARMESGWLQTCKFIHDRMLQAAYESLEVSLCQQTHLKIGRTLYRLCPEGELERNVFDIVEQWNQGIDWITDSDELLLLAKLNCLAAEQAKAASVWQAMLLYAQCGLRLLPECSWQQEYELTLRLNLFEAESHFLLGEIETSEAAYEKLMPFVTGSQMRAIIYCDRLVQAIGAGKWLQGCEYGNLGLRALGFTVPQDEAELKKSIADLASRANLQSVLQQPLKPQDLPNLTDATLLIASRLIANTGQVSYIIDRHLLQTYFFELGWELTYSEGKSEMTPLLLACYANLLTFQFRLPEAEAIGRACKRFIDYYPNAPEMANSLNLLAGVNWYFFSPYSEVIELHELAYELGQQSGEMSRSVISHCNTLFLYVAMGTPLREIQTLARDCDVECRQTQTFSVIPLVSDKLVKALINSGTPEDLGDEAFPESLLDKIRDTFHYVYLLCYRLQLAFWCDDQAISEQLSVAVYQRHHRIPKFCCYVDYMLHAVLTLLRVERPLSTEEAELLKDFSHRFEQLAEFNPDNFGHKYQLIEAERLRIAGDQSAKCMRHYEAAIESARTNGFRNYCALAHECYGKYLLSLELIRYGELHLQEALQLYHEWQCGVRVDQLMQAYPFLTVRQTNTSGGASPSGTGLRSSSSLRQGLDVDSIMKSAQALSSELDLKGLAEKVLEVIMENAGAQFGVWILQRGEASTVEALIDQEAGEREILSHRPVLECQDLPIALINLTLRTGKVINLQDAATDGAFSADDYLSRKQPKSVLCVPALFRDKQVGVLYLENNISRGAFTDDRLDVIRMLLTQAAISFENAQLFSQLQELNTSLEEKVDQRTAELDKAVDELRVANQELEAFSYSVSHDLRAPLRVMKGFSDVILEDYSSMLPEDGQLLLTRIIDSGQKMTLLIDGLLEMSRVQRRELEYTDVDLSALAQQAVKDMQERFPQRVVASVIQANCHARADQRLAVSILENLIGNAWKYSSKVKAASVSFGQLPAGSVIPKGVGLVPNECPDGYGIFFVGDNGAGFDMDHAENLFESFKRLHSERDFEGSGIGLATVRRIVEKHGGSIWVEAYVGQGATFYFTLPLA